MDNKKHPINKLLYACYSMRTDHDNRNFGDEQEWIRHIYAALDELDEMDLWADCIEWGNVKDLKEELRESQEKLDLIEEMFPGELDDILGA